MGFRQLSAAPTALFLLHILDLEQSLWQDLAIDKYCIIILTMKTHPITDKFAAGLSIACALHCLLVPSFLIVTSGALALSIDNELIHWAILFLAIPISVYALITGVSNHNDYGVFLVGLAGLGVLTAIALSESFLTETSVIIFTFIGSALVVYAHTKNFQLCKELDCDCHDVV